MGAKINLLGQKFNRLTVIEETEKRDSSGSIIWKCQCDCGNYTEASTNALRSNHKKSCGCLNKEQVVEMGHNNAKDMLGKRFGKLTVIEKSEIVKDRKICWICKCDCGNTCIVSGKALRNGTTQSCGCLKSVGEQKITSILQQNNIFFEREKIFNDFKPYRYDFYVNNEYVIEYDGRQHFQDYNWGKEEYSLQRTQERDALKNSYCLKNNIPIIRIPYTHYEEIILEDLLLNTSKFIITKE